MHIICIYFFLSTKNHLRVQHSPVEVHKTHDHANYHKAADVGQMLIVYEDDYAMEEAENEMGIYDWWLSIILSFRFDTTNE